MAEYGEDWTGGFDGKANVQLDSVKKMLTMQQKWLKSDLAEVSPDGHVDLEAGFQNIMDHNIVSFPKAMWYMSRFTNYMPDEKGNWYIAKCPTFEEGQKCSVGIGGTGTVVTQQSKAKELAAEFLCWAKMSEVGEQNIWDTLGLMYVTQLAGQMIHLLTMMRTSTISSSSTIHTMCSILSEWTILARFL